MLDSRWIVLCLTLAADPSGTARVGLSSLEVFVSPDLGAFSTGRLQRGDRVSVRQDTDDGWVEIDPPADSLSWIDRDALRREADGSTRVVVDRAVVRPGREEAKMPGPPSAVLRKGAAVRRLDVPPIVLQQGGTSRTWVAIASPNGERRYVRGDGLRRVSSPEAPNEPDLGPGFGRSLPVLSFDRSLASISPRGEGTELSPELKNFLRPIEEDHRRILRFSPDRWELGPILAEYQAAMDQHADPAAKSLIKGRINHIGRQTQLARAAREFEKRLQVSRARDRDVESLRRRLREADSALGEAFDAEGILQASNKMSQGQTLSVLIGSEGEPSAYILVPPGLALKPYLDRRVGVRGQVHYDEHLRARLIEAREIESLKPAP